jgi:hypothetical protein
VVAEGGNVCSAVDNDAERSTNLLKITTKKLMKITTDAMKRNAIADHLHIFGPDWYNHRRQIPAFNCFKTEGSLRCRRLAVVSEEGGVHVDNTKIV